MKVRQGSFKYEIYHHTDGVRRSCVPPPKALFVTTGISSKVKLPQPLQLGPSTLSGAHASKHFPQSDTIGKLSLATNESIV